MSTDHPTPATPDPVGAPGLPVGARFDPVTGAELRAGAGAAGERRQSYALQPGEPVASFSLVTSLLPLASGAAPQTYRWALALGVLIPVVAGALGYLAFAFVAAALVVPAVYLVYMYDVNQWEDEPLGVVLGAVGAAAALGVGFTFLWHAGILGDTLQPVALDGHAGAVQWKSLLVLVLLVPVVSELLKEVGPLVLARRPAFDDMIDGLTFGVAAGAAYAAAETIVVNRSLFSSFGSIDHPNAGFWVSLVLSAAVVKPIVYGAASGIAVASFSGLGSGYDGFKPGYYRGLAEALVANILFQGGLFFAARIQGTSGAIIGLVWGALVAAALVVRLRYFLHFAVLESALAAAATGALPKDAAHGTAYCPSCEMPLLAGASFCVVCGTATRAGNKVTRTRNRTDDTAPDAAPVAPSLRGAPPAGQAPQDNRTTALVLAAVAATILVGGGIGQAAAAAGADHSTPRHPPITLPAHPGQGPTTEPAPSEVPAPGPSVDPSVTPESLAGAQGLSGALGTSPGPATSASTSPGGFPSPSEVGTPSAEPSSTSSPSSPSAPSSGDFVELDGPLGFVLPNGWTVDQQTTGLAIVDGNGGVFIGQLTSPPVDGQTLITNNVADLQSLGIQDLQTADPQQLDPPNSDVVSAYEMDYAGTLASQQGGTLPVEGFALYFVLQDGRGVTATALYPQGAITSESDPLFVDYTTIIQSLLGTL